MSFCGRRTYIDANGKCHNIAGKTVHEIKALVNKPNEFTFGDGSCTQAMCEYDGKPLPDQQQSACCDDYFKEKARRTPAKF